MTSADYLANAKAAFATQFGAQPTHGASAPGRVNVIGEHVDYCDGFVFPMVGVMHHDEFPRVASKFTNEQQYSCWDTVETPFQVVGRV